MQKHLDIKTVVKFILVTILSIIYLKITELLAEASTINRIDNLSDFSLFYFTQLFILIFAIIAYGRVLKKPN